MPRTVKHFSLHRIDATELQVVSDIEVGVLPVIEAEETVIRGYIQQDSWPHREVTLFILQDLEPLIRQLRAGAELPPGGAAALEYRPVVNAYDLADLAACHVFINWQVMKKEGYADDPVAVQGLLAHEHAHPLAENETTQASRGLRMQLLVQGLPDGQLGTEDRKDKIHRLLLLLAEKLCLYAPREVFANEMTIRSGFGEALLHLDECTIANAQRSVAGRKELQQQLLQEVSEKALTPTGADLLLLIGDLKGYLDLALEVAPFYRTGREAEAQRLERALEDEVFPHLEPEVPGAYTRLREQYVALGAKLTPAELVTWGDDVLTGLAEILAKRELIVQYCLQVADN